MKRDLPLLLIVAFFIGCNGKNGFSSKGSASILPKPTPETPVNSEDWHLISKKNAEQQQELNNRLHTSVEAFQIRAVKFSTSGNLIDAIHGYAAFDFTVDKMNKDEQITQVLFLSINPDMKILECKELKAKTVMTQSSEEFQTTWRCFYAYKANPMTHLRYIGNQYKILAKDEIKGIEFAKVDYINMCVFPEEDIANPCNTVTPGEFPVLENIPANTSAADMIVDPKVAMGPSAFLDSTAMAVDVAKCFTANKEKNQCQVLSP